MTSLPAAQYQFEPLSLHHDRAGFSCGVDALDRYLKTQARQDVERDLASVFVLTPDGQTIAGFYTLSANSILAKDLPRDHARKLPRFPLPVTLLGRMAVSARLQAQGFGYILLTDALRRSLLGSRNIASLAVIVDAKAGARNFWIKHGFMAFESDPNRLFLTMETIRKL